MPRRTYKPARPRRFPFPEDRTVEEYRPNLAAFVFVTRDPLPARPPRKASTPTSTPTPTSTSTPTPPPRTLPDPASLVPLTRADLAGLLGAHTSAHLDHGARQDAVLCDALRSGLLKPTGRGAARKYLKTTGTGLGLGLGARSSVDSVLVAFRVALGEDRQRATDRTPTAEE